MADKEDRIIDAISELESDESFGRVLGEALEIVAKRGKPTWEALEEMLKSSDQRDEIMMQFGLIYDNWVAEGTEAEEDEEEDEDLIREDLGDD